MNGLLSALPDSLVTERGEKYDLLDTRVRKRLSGGQWMLPARPEQRYDDRGGVVRLALDLQSALTIEDVHRLYLGAVAGVVAADAYGFSQFTSAGRRLLVNNTSTRAAPEGLVADYNSVGAEMDPVLNLSMRTGAPVDDSRAVSERVWSSSPTSEVLRRHGLSHSLVAPLRGNRGVIGALYLARKTGAEPFSPQDLVDINLAQQHVEAALGRAIRQAELHRRAALVGHAFDQLEAAVVVADGTGVLFESKAARRLRATDPLVDARIAELVAANVDEIGRSGRRVLERFVSIDLQRDGGELEPRTHRLTVRSTVSPVQQLDAVVSFVHLQTRDRHPRMDGSPLSAREREIVVWVAQGLTNRQIAELAFVSENTVRQHLKRIFKKLDVRSRAQLVQAVWQNDDNANT
jgi:DNA-binding CsgD family transcriptional regulator/GAF domain-containing protein